jgi:hypothetical protein
MRATFGIVFITLVAASAGGADDPKSKKAAKRDSKALEILKQMTTLYQNAKTLHVEASIDTTIQNGEDKQEMHAQSVYDLERPDHVALHARHAKDKDAGVDFVSDGKTQFLHSLRFKQYTESPAPKKVSEFGLSFARISRANTGFFFPNLLTDDLYESLVEDIYSCAYAGKQKLGEVEANHIKVVHPELKWEAWIAATGKPHVLKVITLVAVDEYRAEGVESFKEWKLDEPPANSAFSFAPPPSATKVDVLGPQKPKK